jgi:hypothetical protein
VSECGEDVVFWKMTARIGWCCMAYDKHGDHREVGPVVEGREVAGAGLA